jgi:hypothetical protein
VRDHFGSEFCVLVTYDVGEPIRWSTVVDAHVARQRRQEIAQFADGVPVARPRARGSSKGLRRRGVVMQRRPYRLPDRSQRRRSHGIRGSVRFWARVPTSSRK